VGEKGPPFERFMIKVLLLCWEAGSKTWHKLFGRNNILSLQKLNGVLKWLLSWSLEKTFHIRPVLKNYQNS